MTVGEQIDVRSYKDALAAWTSGICILTAAAADGERAGLTVSSFCSVSLRPPTVLANVERAGHTHALVVASQCFAINLLRAEQRALGERFAGLHGDVDRFAGADWRPGLATGAPLLVGALAWLECRLLQRHEVGEHSILVGLVLAAEAGEDSGAPLAYYRRQWGSFRPDGGS